MWLIDQPRSRQSPNHSRTADRAEGIPAPRSWDMLESSTDRMRTWTTKEIQTMTTTRSRNKLITRRKPVAIAMLAAVAMLMGLAAPAGAEPKGHIEAELGVATSTEHSIRARTYCLSSGAPPKSSVTTIPTTRSMQSQGSPPCGSSCAAMARPTSRSTTRTSRSTSMRQSSPTGQPGSARCAPVGLRQLRNERNQTRYTRLSRGRGAHDQLA